MSHPIQPAHGATSTGLAPNVAGALSYVFGFVSGIVFLFIEKENAYVRFHAAQSIVVSAAILVLNIVLSIASGILGSLPGIGWMLAIAMFLVSMVVGLGALVLYVLMIVKAFSGNEWELPVAGRYARQIAGSVRV